MKTISILTTILLLAITSASFGQRNSSKRKAVSSETIKSSSQSETMNKRNGTSLKKHELVSGKEVPSDFPKFITTGNKEKDATAHKTAKLKWINENPERYQTLFREKKSK